MLQRRMSAFLQGNIGFRMGDSEIVYIMSEVEEIKTSEVAFMLIVVWPQSYMACLLPCQGCCEYLQEPCQSGNMACLAMRAHKLSAHGSRKPKPIFHKKLLVPLIILMLGLITVAESHCF